MNGPPSRHQGACRAAECHRTDVRARRGGHRHAGEPHRCDVVGHASGAVAAAGATELGPRPATARRPHRAGRAGRIDRGGRPRAGDRARGSDGRRRGGDLRGPRWPRGGRRRSGGTDGGRSSQRGPAHPALGLRPRHLQSTARRTPVLRPETRSRRPDRRHRHRARPRPQRSAHGRFRRRVLRPSNADRHLLGPR